MGSGEGAVVGQKLLIFREGAGGQREVVSEAEITEVTDKQSRAKFSPTDTKPIAPGLESHRTNLGHLSEIAGAPRFTPRAVEEHHHLRRGVLHRPRSATAPAGARKRGVWGPFRGPHFSQGSWKNQQPVARLAVFTFDEDAELSHHGCPAEALGREFERRRASCPGPDSAAHRCRSCDPRAARSERRTARGSGRSAVTSVTVMFYPEPGVGERRRPAPALRSVAGS